MGRDGGREREREREVGKIGGGVLEENRNNLHNMQLLGRHMEPLKIESFPFVLSLTHQARDGSYRSKIVCRAYTLVSSVSVLFNTLQVFHRVL